jgi:uncharacterized membrane protein YkgB
LSDRFEGPEDCVEIAVPAVDVAIHAAGDTTLSLSEHRISSMRAELKLVVRALPARYEARISRLDDRIIETLGDFGVPAARLAIGLTFIWFGALKPLGMSPAADLVARTVYFVPPELFIPFLGLWEVAIGLCLLYKPLLRAGLFLLSLQMIGTFLPLVLLPEVTFTAVPYALTLEGQYIVKNLVMIAAAMIVGSSVGSISETDD